jgi:hypothetical protein
MTLVNAFRARNGGILLCADREEHEWYSKNEIEKIYPITTDLKSCAVFITGAGPSEIIGKAYENVHKTLLQADRGKYDVVAEHQTLIEGSLRQLYKDYKSVLAKEPMGLIVVIAPRDVRLRTTPPPLLYTTVEWRLRSQQTYCAHGSGKAISDYLTDRLYVHGMTNNLLKLLAIFIFREAERKAVGVGMGNDMWLIHESGQTSREGIGWDTVERMKKEIPNLADSLYASWGDSPSLQEWLKL